MLLTTYQENRRPAITTKLTKGNLTKDSAQINRQLVASISDKRESAENIVNCILKIILYLS